MEKNFKIDRAEWHTKRIRNYKINNNAVYQYFISFFKFLDKNSLSKRVMFDPNLQLNDDLEFSSDDLTEEGLLLVRKAYDKWANDIVEKNKSPEDIKYLVKHLSKIRNM
jgi:hypothetical protein